MTYPADNSHHSPSVKQSNTDPFIFSSVAVVIISLVIYCIIDAENAGALFNSVRAIAVSQFSWLFVLSVTGFVLFSLFLAFSRYGKIRLGPKEAAANFSRVSWFSMLFSAGMGIGLVFYGVAEPILHFAHPPETEALSPAAARDAMRFSIFHWGIHAWAIYAVMGLALAFSHHYQGLPLAIRSTLKPILGKQTNRALGKHIDVLAALATIFGLATSLGLGAAQINAGLNRLFGITLSTETEIIIIAIITLCATLSLLTGLDRGIKRLSEINLLLALLLLIMVFLTGPTAYILRALPDHIGSYTQTVLGMSLFTNTFGSAEWQQDWTVFYWAWWVSWAPFVGMFIARISRGRTIKEFVLGVLLVPTSACIVWFTVFGTSALQIELFGTGGIVDAVNENTATALFVLLEQFPFATVTSFIGICLVAIFFITSSDSGSFVVDMLVSGGNPNPALWQRIFWALTEGIIAATLLIIGGLSALQAGAISTGLPFCIVLIFVCYSLMKNLKSTEEH